MIYALQIDLWSPFYFTLHSYLIMKHIIFLFVFCIKYSLCLCQNLLHNGDFENLSKCPDYAGDIEYAIGWHNGGYTPDLFNSCTNNIENGLSIPDTYKGYIHPISGKSCIGLVLFTKKNKIPLKESYKYSESIYTKIISGLWQDKKYTVSLWLALADSSIYYSKTINVVLFDKLSGNGLFKNKQVLSLAIPFDNSKSKQHDWHHVVMQFTCSNNWNYMWIGMDKDEFTFKEFVNDTRDKLKINKTFNKGDKDCYYYIDNVEINEVIR